MSSDWYLIKGNSFYSGYESDQFNQLSPTVFDELLSVSPEAYDVTVNGVSKKVIIQHEQDGDKRILLSKIGEVGIGNLVVYDNKNWLVVDYPTNDKINDHNIIQLCNTTFSFTGQPTQVDTGKTTDWGEPIYDNQPGQLYSYQCIVSSVRDLFSGDNSSNSINIVDSKLALIIQYDNNTELKENVEFDLFGNHYRIYGFDRSKILNDTGLLIVLADKH